MYALQKVREIRTDLEIRRSKADDYTTKNDYFIADIYLKQLEDFLQKAMNHSLKKVELEMFRMHQTGYPIVREPRIPITFINDNPVLSLFMFNILDRLTRCEVMNFLRSKGCTDFEVTSVKCKHNCSSAIIQCKNLAASVNIQVLACKKELEYVYPNGKSSFWKTRQEQNCCIQNNFIGERNVNFDHKVFPEQLHTILNCLPVVRTVAKFLSPVDFFHFYEACHECRMLRGLSTGFTSSLARYQNACGLAVMIDDTKTFTLNRFKFEGHIYPIEPHIVIKMLDITLKKQRTKLQRYKIIDLNLVEVNATDELLAMMSSSFSIKNLTLGKTKLKAQHKITFGEVEKLSIINNDEYSFKHFSVETFPVLTVLTLINCKCIKIAQVLQYIRNSETLKQLYIVDCQFTDRHPNDVAEAVMSGENKIEIFHYMFTPNFIQTPTEVNIPNLTVSPYIKSINFNYNMHYKEYINYMLQNLPALENLHLLGLDFSEAISISTPLKTLQLNYFVLLNATLDNLDVSELSKLHINNTLGKKKTEALDLHFLFKAFHVKKPLDIEFVKCKFLRFKEIEKKCKKLNIDVVQNMHTTTFSYKK